MSLKLSDYMYHNSAQFLSLNLTNQPCINQPLIMVVSLTFKMFEFSDISPARKQFCLETHWLPYMEAHGISRNSSIPQKGVIFVKF